ncbi:uncharacterized protein BJ171DRAFT_636837 [Polychytrium aggregatum]|uniref:uncharacterized protein n=1 Tax=Polychytrium aggregatum TaxID=110093 RepID=UPI0022FEFDAE|nr:uncharacterized protein BJ171DRAFT_636837 [Polychytrium aggregatum]KAI9193471.1 hypothetical protein BJ171DRAFT_636837 [Polychytrium aggregatum]
MASQAFVPTDPEVPVPPPLSTIEASSVDLHASDSATLNRDSCCSSRSSRSAKFKFDGIYSSATRLPDSLVSRAKQGDPSACFDAAKLVSEGLPIDHNEWKLAAQLFKAAAERGNLEASFQMAWVAFLGEGMVKNDRRALWFWQEVSSKSTDPVLKPIATHMVGWMHYLGRGTPLDKQNGIKTIRDNQSDDFKLGEDECLVKWWNNVKSESPTAHKFFELCQSGSDRDWLCSHLMAVCLFHGFGTTQDQTRAARTFEQLANDGHSDSQVWIGMSYDYGDGVSRDLVRAFEWYSKSTKQDNSYGQWRVGRCYYYGRGVAKDKRKAFEWFSKSAEQGNRYGQCWVGWCRNEGDGVPKDIDSAIFWWQQSADQGNRDAITTLKYLGKWP